MPDIVPTLWFADNNTQEAIDYYLSVFPNSSFDSVMYYPKEELDEHFVGMGGKILQAKFNLNGQPFWAFDGGDYFRFNEAISFTVMCADQAELDYYWSRLSHHPESEQCGWCKDKFGISWQIIPAGLDQLMQTDAQIQALLKMSKINIQELADLAE